MMAMRNLPRRTRRNTALAACVVALPLALTACGGDDGSESGEGEESGGGDVSLQLAHSYRTPSRSTRAAPRSSPTRSRRPARGWVSRSSAASQLGGDADRITSVAAGDIDMDIQGASALSALYAPMSVVDGAFVFDDAEHLKRFFTE